MINLVISIVMTIMIIEENVIVQVVILLSIKEILLQVRASLLRRTTLININLLQEVAIAKAIVDLVEVDKLLTSYNGIMLDL